MLKFSTNLKNVCSILIFSKCLESFPLHELSKSIDEAVIGITQHNRRCCINPNWTYNTDLFGYGVNTSQEDFTRLTEAVIIFEDLVGGREVQLNNNNLLTS